MAVQNHGDKFARIKNQEPNNRQTEKWKMQETARRHAVSIIALWSLDFVWFLVFGSWNFRAAIVAFLCLCSSFAHAATVSEPPPDPGFEISVQAADVIVDCEIVAGGPFRAAAVTKKAIKGTIPPVFELEGFNSYNWDSVHQGFAAGSRLILFLSRTEKPDVFATLTPAAPRLRVQQEGILLTLGDPPFRIPIKRAVMEEALALMMEQSADGKCPERAEKFIRGLFDAGDIEPRYLAVTLAGSLHDPRCAQLLIDASKDKLLKMRLTAIDALGKVSTPQTSNTLRILLRDEKATVAREAARVLVAVRDADALPDLLEWVRKHANSFSKTKDKDPDKPADVNRARADSVAADAMAFAIVAAPLLNPDSLSRPLFEIARSADEALGRQAIQAIAANAQAPQIMALLELADDAGYALRSRAADALQRLTLMPFKNADAFRSWWAQAGKGFGEDLKRDRVEAIVKTLPKIEDNYDRRNAAESVRLAPGEIALVSAAPLMLKKETQTLFSAEDLTNWNSPLAVPFLIERLGREELGERRDALNGLIQLCSRHARLRAALWPLIRGNLAEEDSTLRRTAQSAAGKFSQTDGLTALVDVMQYYGGYESVDAARAAYGMTARTLGFAGGEPIPDQQAAARRYRGWLNATSDFRPLQVINGIPPALRLWPDLDTAARQAKVEAIILEADSRRAGAAFALALEEHPPADPLWKKLLAQGRQRDRAHGMAAMIGSEAPVADAAKWLAAEGEGAQPALIRALSAVVLATQKGTASKAGSEKLVEWLKGPGAKAELPWRRMGIVALGLVDNDPASMSFLGTVLTPALAEKDDPTEKANDNQLLLHAVLTAICARADCTPLLQKALDESGSKRVREIATRALSIRRFRGAIPSIVKAIDKSDRTGWQDLARSLDPLVSANDADKINELLDSVNTPARSAAAYLLATRPDLGNDPETRGRLITGLSDTSYIVRWQCCIALGKRRTVSAIKKLIELLADDEDEVRAAAAEAIGLIGDRDACRVAALAVDRQARLDIRWLRAMAIAGQRAHMDLLMKVVNSTAYIEQRSGLEAIAGSPLPIGLQTVLKTFRNDEAALQTIAADALAARGEQAVTALQDDLKNEDKEVRGRAIHLLSRIDTPGSKAALENAARDADPNLRALAEFGLQRLTKKATLK